MTNSVLLVPGLERLSDGALFQFAAMCDRHDWNADALAAVLSSESGFQTNAGSYAWSPKRTASGLLQFIESTAKGLGVGGSTSRPDHVPDVGGGKAWATWTVLRMTAEEQLRLVEAYYVRAFASRAPVRPVDYYLPAWGAWHGLALDHVLATKGQNVYEVNKGLDVDRNGVITVSDLAARVASRMAEAKGRRRTVIEPEGYLEPRAGAVVGFLALAGLTFLYVKNRRKVG
jgi:hypothetical protein